MPNDVHPLIAAVYAKDARRLAGFYLEVLALSRVEEGSTFVLLGSERFELVIVQAPDAVAASIEITEPPEVRIDMPMKLSFSVPNIESLRPTILRLGGGLKSWDAAWSWRSAKHLDGWDPEGNVFQLRQREA